MSASCSRHEMISAKKFHYRFSLFFRHTEGLQIIWFSQFVRAAVEGYIDLMRDSHRVRRNPPETWIAYISHPTIAILGQNFFFLPTLRHFGENNTLIYHTISLMHEKCECKKYFWTCWWFIPNIIECIEKSCKNPDLILHSFIRFYFLGVLCARSTFDYDSFSS